MACGKIGEKKMHVIIMLINSEIKLATSVVVPSISIFASLWVSLQLFPYLFAKNTLTLFRILAGLISVFTGAWTTRRAISVVAVDAMLPFLNQSLASAWTYSNTKDEFKNLAIVNLIATDTFKLVWVLCYSYWENFRITKIRSPFIMMITSDDKSARA